MEENRKEDVEMTLARARKTVAESRTLLEQVNLRLQETDRFLAKQGLTREQVRNMRFTKEQRLLANAELKRRGLPPIEDDDLDADFDAATAAVRAAQLELPPDPGESGRDMLAERQRKFGNFMQTYRI